MSNDEIEVLAATKRFYDAIETMVSGGGLEPMKAAWHQGADVTSGHPTGSWAQGWAEVLATWEVFASFGRPEAAGSSIQGLRAHVFGDTAYTISVFHSSAAFGRATMNCTNVLRRIDGAWKLVHHHADRTPALEQSLEAMASES
jgi:ketosteroid isomerase-like protein